MKDFEKIEKYIDFIGTVGNDTNKEQLTTVLPDNSILLGFQLGQQVYEIVGDQREAMTSTGVCGQLTRKKEYLNTPQSHTILLKFKPWSASLFFNDIEALTDQNIDLSCLVSSSTIYQTLEKLDNRSNKLEVVKGFLLSQFNQRNVAPSILQAIDLIYRRKGNIRVDKLAYEVCNSKRNFERKFKSTTGLTPKKFITNTRFQYSLKLLQSTQDLQDVAFLSGYYDLPHFINDFKSVTGITPEKYTN